MNSKWVAVLPIFLILLFETACNARKVYVMNPANTSGNEKNIVALAIDELERRGYPSVGYTAKLVVRDEEFVVLLQSGRAEPGSRGNIGSQPCFEVGIDPHTLAIIRFNLVR